VKERRKERQVINTAAYKSGGRVANRVSEAGRREMSRVRVRPVMQVGDTVQQVRFCIEAAAARR